MASKAFTTTFLSPFSLPNHLSFFSDRALSSSSKPTPIVCKISPQSNQKSPLSGTNFAGSQQEIDGAGAASPTPGDRFLERYRAVEAAKLVLKDSRRDKKRDKGLMVSLAVASCYGCGAPLQTSDFDAPGFVDLDTYELKKKHHQLRTVLCGRCRLLSHGHMITAVGGNGGYQGGKIFITAEQLREKLAHLRYEKALIVKLVDIVDFNGSFLARVRDLAGANPIILVVTKVDLLPKGTDLNCIGDWVVEATTRKKLNVLSVHLTSSKSLVGIAGVVSEIQKEKKGRDVYILGSANVGKSAFVNALLKTMSRKDPIAAAAQRYKPIQSAVPGTTLGPIQINAFIGGGKLYDTPGVHVHHRLAAVVDSEDLPVLAPQSRLRGQSLPIPIENETGIEVTSNALNGFSIFWGGLVRIDILKVIPETCFTFYGPKALQIHTVPTDKADEFYKRELGVLLTPPSGKLRADNWRGLETERKLKIKYDDVQRPPCDIAISGVGWIALDTMKAHQASSSASEEPASGELHLAVRVPRSVEIFVRPPLPVGKAGAERYQYRKLTEKEEEGRPKWYF